MKKTPTLEERWATDDPQFKVESLEDYLGESEPKKTKAASQPTRYRKAIGKKNCGNCRFFGGGICAKHKFKAQADYVCPDWEKPESKKMVSSTPTAVYGHGPGGTFSPSGLSGKRKKEFHPFSELAHSLPYGEAHQIGRVLVPVTTKEAAVTRAKGYMLLQKMRNPIAYKDGKYSWASTQINLPIVKSLHVRSMGLSIDKDDLHEYGLEKEPHVTVKYGLVPYALQDIALMLSESAPIDIEIGGLSLFKQPDFDVLKLDIISPSLRALNLAIGRKIVHITTHDGYTPHVTVAYLKPGMGEKYLSMSNPLQGSRFTADEILYSGKFGEQVSIELGTMTKTKAPPMKKEIDGYHPKGHYLVIVDEKRPSTWHLRVRNQKGAIDKRLLGAAHAALTIGYRGNKYKGPDKAKALAKLLKLRKSAKVHKWDDKIVNASIGVKQKRPFLTVFKDKNDEYRWVAISSNSYRDRDEEIVSKKALDQDVLWADTSGDYGTLRFWHMPGVDIGDCDFNMMHGKMLVESGTFRTKEIALAVAEKASDYQLSIGFKHPPSEPDKNGVFHTIRRFERSLVPSGRAANPFTSLSVRKKETTMSTTEKVRALKALLKDDAVVDGLLAGATASEKQADEWGIANKSDDPAFDLHNLNSHELMEYAFALKAAESDEDEDDEQEYERKMKPKKRPLPAFLKKRAQAKVEEEDDEEEEYSSKMDMPDGKDDKNPLTALSKKMDGYMEKMTDMEAKMAEHLSMHGKRQKEASFVNEALDAQSLRVTQVEEYQNAMIDFLDETRKEIASLRGDLPSAIADGVRPTRSQKNLTNQEPVYGKSYKNGQAQQGNGAGLLDFITGDLS